MYSGVQWTTLASASLLFRIILGGGRIPLFMLIGWHTAKVTFFARGRSTFGQIGSMDCLLERSYCLQTHAPATVDPQINYEDFKKILSLSTLNSLFCHSAFCSCVRQKACKLGGSLWYICRTKGRNIP